MTRWIRNCCISCSGKIQQNCIKWFIKYLAAFSKKKITWIVIIFSLAVCTLQEGFMTEYKLLTYFYNKLECAGIECG